MEPENGYFYNAHFAIVEHSNAYANAVINGSNVLQFS